MKTFLVLLGAALVAHAEPTQKQSPSKYPDQCLFENTIPAEKLKQLRAQAITTFKAVTNPEHPALSESSGSASKLSPDVTFVISKRHMFNGKVYATGHLANDKDKKLILLCLE